ncbi:MAG: hypothetical protein II336_09670 [Loktanella sp.]|nr:hypothetical protein [Loktanella sp.]
MPATTILLPISRDSVAEVELTGAVPSFFQAGTVKDAQHIQQLPTIAAKRVAQLRLGSGHAAVTTDFGHTVMQPQGVVLLGFIISITRSLRDSSGQTKDQKGKTKVFHDSSLTR